MTEQIHLHRRSEQSRHEEVLQDRPENTVVLTDIGRDSDDMMALVLGSRLVRDRTMDIKGVVSTLTPASRRAQLARYTLDMVGLSDVPVGVGSNIPSLGEDQVHPYEFRGLPYRTEQKVTGSQIFERTLRQVGDHSLNFLVIASFTDLSLYLARTQDAQELFRKKVKNVIIMGGVAVDDGQVIRNGKGFFIPDTSANYQFDPEAAASAFDFFQASNIPMTLVSRHAVNAAQLPRETLDTLGETGHPVGQWLKNVSEEGFNSLWERSNLPADDPSRALPARCDRAWFITTFCGGEQVQPGDPIWPHIKSISVYDPIAMLAVSPSLSETFFAPTEVLTMGTQHRIIGVSPEQTGVKNPGELQSFIRNGLVRALQESLSQ